MSESKSSKLDDVVDNISDRDIVSIDSHALYSPSQSATYAVSTINTYNSITSLNQDVSFSGNSIAVLPASAEITRDLRLIYRVDSPIQPTQATADLTRMRRWDAEPYEELNLTVTEKHCLLTAGDIVQLSSMYIWTERGIRRHLQSTARNGLGCSLESLTKYVNLTLGVMS